MKGSNIFFKESSDGWVLEAELFNQQWQCLVYTYIATFSSRKAATEYYKKHYSTYAG